MSITRASHRSWPAWCIAAGALVVASTGTALAGTGVGGVFNLGQANTVNETTSLSGAKNGAMLSVENTSTGAAATGLRILTPSGRPPFTVNRTQKVLNLNADQVDGFSANGLNRVGAQSGRNYFYFENGRSVLQTVTITAPTTGYVLLTGQASALFNGGCAFCVVHLRFSEAGVDTPEAASSVNGTSAQTISPVSSAITVPVTPGPHTFDLVASWYDVNGGGAVPDWSNAALNAQYVPFDGAGGNTAGTTTTSSVASARQTSPTGTR